MPRSLADYEAYLFDVDGTLVQPGAAIPGAESAIAALKARGKAIRAVTNNSRVPPRDVAERLRGLGLPLDDAEVFSALSATARFVAHEHPGARVHVFGSPGLRAELERMGLEVTEGAEADVVVVGLNQDVDYAGLTLAMRALLGGARFIAVNVDRLYVGPDGLIPGAGVFVAGLERAVGRGPDVIVGKPSTTILQEAVASVGYPARACLFVGDNPEADVAVAHAVGMDALLVLTGVATADDLGPTGLAVEHVLPSVADLIPYLTR
jgi:HAD superfamily hydrolase (TIGR01450 family)